MKKEKHSLWNWMGAGICILLLYGIHLCIYLNGDDFMYATFAHQGILQNVWSYYHTGNGRLWINILDSALLFFDRYLFILLNPLLIIAFLWLLAKNVQTVLGESIHRDFRRLVFTGGVLLFALDVLCLRETVFWITGMMNYLFPATVFLLGLLMFQYARAGRITSKQWPLYWLLCLLAGSSVEQYALMFIGVMTLMLGMDLLSKKKNAYPIWVGYIMSIVGLLILVLAPGNFVRIGVQAELKPTLIDNIWTLFYQNTFSPVAVPFIFMLAICASITFYNQKKSVFNLLLGLTPLAMLLIEAIPAFEKAVLIVLVCLPLLAQMLRLFMLRKYTYKTQVLSLIFVGLGSQIMLLISAIWGFRCMFSMYVIYMLLIMIFLQEMDKKAQRFILCSGITISIHPLLTVGYWCVTLLLQLMKKESVQTILSKILLRGSVISALVILLVGYARNVETHLQNLESTHNPVNQITTLKELPDDKYSWYFIPFGDFHEEYYRLLNHMSEDAKIEYIVIKAENKCP